MRLLFKQRLFSWFDSYDIFDEEGNTVYTVKGELSWGHRLQIYDAAGRAIGRVQERVLTLLPKFELYAGEQTAPGLLCGCPKSSGTGPTPTAWTSPARRTRCTA